MGRKKGKTQSGEKKGKGDDQGKSQQKPISPETETISSKSSEVSKQSQPSSSKAADKGQKPTPQAAENIPVESSEISKQGEVSSSGGSKRRRKKAQQTPESIASKSTEVSKQSEQQPSTISSETSELTSPETENVLSKIFEAAKQSQQATSKASNKGKKQILQITKTVPLESSEASKQEQTAPSGTSSKKQRKTQQTAKSGPGRIAEFSKQGEAQPSTISGETEKPTPQSAKSISSKSSAISEQSTITSSTISGKAKKPTPQITKSILGKSSTISEPSATQSSKASSKVQKAPPSKKTEVEKSIVVYKGSPQKLATAELPDYKFYRLRNQDKDKLTVGKDLSILTNVYDFKFSDNLYVDLYSVHFLNSEKKEDEKFKQSKKRDVVMKILYREIQNKSDLNNFIYDDHNLLYVKSGVFKEKKYEYCVDPDARRVMYIRFEKAKHLPIILSNTDNTTFCESNTFLSLMVTQFSKFSFSQNYNKSCTGIGNELYFRPPSAESDSFSLNFMKQIWPSLCFNILLGPRGIPLINVNQNHAVFAKSDLTVIDYYCYINGVDRRKVNLSNVSMNENQRKNLTNILKGLNLTVEYNKLREFTIFKVIDKIPEKTFIDKDGKKMSILQYFNQQYNIKLKCPRLPLLQMNPESANILIPMELVKVSDKPQKLRRKLEGELTAKMIRKCTKSPATLFKEINTNLDVVKKDANDVLKIFGANIGNQIKTVAKVLPHIEVKYPVNVEKREPYDKHLKNFSYGVIIVDRSVFKKKYKETIDKVKHIIKNVTNYGCDFSRNLDPRYEIDYDSRSNLFDILKPKLEAIGKNQRKNHLIIFIVGESSSSYGMIKMYCEHKEFLGCHSQVLRTKTLFKLNHNNKYCRVTLNIAMKLNGKLGGLSKNLYFKESDPILTDFCKKFFNEKDATIYIGADVIHPAPQDTGDNRLPSISAVVGSVDILGFKYAISGRIHTTTVQKGKQAMETLQFFKEQIKERLFSFKNSTGVVPRHIVVFRDGISITQFKIAVDYEVSSIHAACKEINEKYEPTITFVVVQKRHGVRFMNLQNSPNYNVPQNTVVANDIVNPEFLDFYAVPHKGALGTSKPCHVYALYDDWNLTLNEISLLTCWMSNVCTRCPDPIGIPTPCYYADLACTRLKHHYIERKEYLRRNKEKKDVTIDIHPLIEGEQFFV
uniref:Piwi domain-containing protein n=2 Tax=Strongyloides papillosus TaxID=174720 RepID=A0A0N5BSZ5_STREA